MGRAGPPAPVDRLDPDPQRQRRGRARRPRCEHGARLHPLRHRARIGAARRDRQLRHRPGLQAPGHRRLGRRHAELGQPHRLRPLRDALAPLRLRGPAEVRREGRGEQRVGRQRGERVLQLRAGLLPARLLAAELAEQRAAKREAKQKRTHRLGPHLYEESSLAAEVPLSDELGDLIGERCIEIAKRGDDVLAQVAEGLVKGDAPGALDGGFVAGADAELEPARRDLVHGHRALSHRDRVAGVGGHDRGAEGDIGNVEQHQSQQKIWRCQAEKTQKGQAVVSGAILVSCRIHAYRKRHDPGKNYGRERDDKGKQQTVADDVADRHVIFERIPHIALQHAQQPHAILLDHWLVEPVLLAEEFDLLDVGAFSLRLQFGNISGEVIAWWQLNDNERQNADRQHRRDHDQNAAHDKRQNRVTPVPRENPGRPSWRWRKPAISRDVCINPI